MKLSLEYVLAQLDRIDALIRLHVARATQATSVDVSSPLEEVLAGPGGLPSWSSSAEWPDPEWESHWRRLNTDLALREEEALRQKVPLRLVELRRRFGLSAVDADIVLLCLAQEVDLRYERVFAFLHGVPSRRHLTIDLALNLLCSSLREKLDGMARLFASGPLIRHGIVSVVDNLDGGGPWLAREIKLDEPILKYLLDSDDMDSMVTSFASWNTPDDTENDAHAELVETVRAVLTRRSDAAPEPLLVHFFGEGCGDGLAVASAACAPFGMAVLVVDGTRLATVTDVDPLVRRLLRETSLRGAALYLECDGATPTSSLSALVQQHARSPGSLTFISRRMPWEPDAKSAVFSLPMALPNTSMRADQWRRALGTGHLDGEIEAAAAKFRFGAAQIRSAAADVLRRAHLRQGSDAVPTVEDLYASCRAHSSQEVDQLARRIHPRYRWEDIVLPADSIEQLREICDRVHQRGRVLDGWGFAGKSSLGRGLHVLFSGPSGAGKTMAAEVIASELRLDLFRIDLSSVVSKYIGETEKNLSRIFAAAEMSHAILFFDEADALFGKRSEVKDAHDRYANVETSYLLQRMEEYDGMTILATNLKRNLDDAFARRMAFAVTFPFPEEAERARIWDRVWPAATPRAPELDLPFMAQQFKLTGGNIKNVALAAAFLAASDGGEVTMRHLVRATKRELQKLGKSPVSSEFGPYAQE